MLKSHSRTSLVNGDQAPQVLTHSSALFQASFLKRICVFQCCDGLTKPNQGPLQQHCMFSPGVVAVVLGDAAVLVWTVEALVFVGTPLGTEVAVCSFVVLFPCTGLTVGSVSEEWEWMKASSGCSGFSVFPVAVKLSATGLEKVVNADSSGAGVPVWVWKEKSSVSLIEF